MLVRFFAIEPFSDILGQFCSVLLFPVDHTAFQREGVLLDGWNRDDFRLDQCQIGFLDLIHISSALAAADLKSFSGESMNRYIHCKFGISIQQFSGIPADPDISNEYGTLPDPSDVSPADDHGVDFIAFFVVRNAPFFRDWAISFE